MATENPPQDEDLPALLSNVAFEVEVFAWALRRATDLRYGAEVERIYQVAIDRSCYVNAAWTAARNLLFFFSNSRWRRGAVVASDYGTWMPVEAQSAIDIANERVVHLATARVSDPKTIDLENLARGLDDSVGRFYRNVLDVELRRRFHPSLADALTAVDQPDRLR